MTKINKDWIDIYFSYGVDYQNRRIFLFDGIEENAISTVIKALYYMDSESNEKPIELFIGSFGGSEYEMFALYDVMRTLHAAIHTIAIGKCMSASPLLVACGESGFRYATPNTFFMVHEGWEDFGEKRYDEMKKELKHRDKISDRWAEAMAKHSKKDVGFWKKLCSQTGDYFFDAYEAQEFGLIDHVWSEKDVDDEE